MFYLSGIALTFFLLLLLTGKEGKTTADKILACWLIVIGLHLFLFYSFISGKIYSYPWLLGFQIPIPLLHGPFLYTYAMALTGNLPASNKKYLLHFIPAILCYAYLIHFFLLPAEQKIFVFNNKGIGYEAFVFINNSAVIISGVVYVFLTARLHNQHRRNILNQFSDTEKINLDWIRYLMYGIALIWVFVIYGDDNLVFGTAVCFVLFMGYFGIRQVGIFTHHGNPPVRDIENPVTELPGNIDENANDLIFSKDVEESNSNEKQDISTSTVDDFLDAGKPGKKKYSRSGLSEEAAEQLHQKLNQIIHSEKIFNQSELTLTDLAKKLGTHPNYLSQVINDKEGKNFYDYINTLRTNEFIRLVSSPGNEKFTLLSLAFECGFNSKSSFNKYFRKVTGLSPSQFLQQRNIKEMV